MELSLRTLFRPSQAYRTTSLKWRVLPASSHTLERAFKLEDGQWIPFP